MTEFELEVLTLLRRIATSLEGLNPSSSLDTTDSESYSVLDPIRLIVSAKLAAEGKFFQHRVDEKFVPFDYPVNPDGTQSIEGLIKDVAIIRGIAGDKAKRSHSASVVVAIAPNRSSLYRINIGSTDTVSARTVLASIANATRDQLVNPIKLAVSMGDATYLVGLKDSTGANISNKGSKASDLSEEEISQLTAGLIEKAIANFHDRFHAVAAVEIFWAVQNGEDPTDRLPLSILALHKEFLTMDSIKQVKARLAEVKSNFGEGDGKPLMPLYQFHKDRLGA